MLNIYTNQSKYLPQKTINFNSKKYRLKILNDINNRNEIRAKNKLPLLDIEAELASILKSEREEQHGQIVRKIKDELNSRRTYPPVKSFISALAKNLKQKKIANRYIKRFLK
jgi:hypothetical protein